MATLDPQFRPFWDALLALPPMSERSLAEIRAPVDRAMFGESPQIREVREVLIEDQGRRIPARLYRPSENPTALMIYFHGGGWVFGSLDTHDVPLRNLARLTNAAILSVDYRLAPEHQFPGGFDDCYAATQWADGHREQLGLGNVPLLVGGDSAGGNLAAAVAMAARDRRGPELAGQLIIYARLFGECDKPSRLQHAGCGLLRIEDSRWYWECYAPTEAARGNPLAAPGCADSHANLAAAIIAVAEIDPLRDDGLDYAQLLREAGQEVVLLRYPTMPHGFFNFGSIVPAAMVATEEIAAEVCKLIERAGSTAR